MSEWVENEIVFEATEQEARAIYDAICVNGKIDFNTLIPMPLNIYRGDVGDEEERDFGRFNCWYRWCNCEWGTKWNARCDSGIFRYDEETGKAVIAFVTAWDVPYPVIVAFGNRFRIPFHLVHFSTADYCYGIERYEVSEEGWIVRTLKQGRFDSHPNPDSLVGQTN